MAGTLGTIKGQMILDVKQALAAYTAVRAAHLTTMTAISTGATALMGAGAAVAAVGIAMGAGLMVAVNAAAEFERKLDYFAAVSNSTQAEYDAIREKALELGQDTIFSANQIADSFVELGKAGVSAKDIIGGVGEGVAALGAAADIPLDTAAQIIMSAVQTFGLSADHAVGVADKLAGAANASIVEVQDLGTSLKYAGGVAASLGIPFEDVNTALALLGTYGLKGSTAGTSLRQILVSLGGATNKATKELQSLGIITEDGSNKFFDANGSAKSLAEIFQILQEATAGMGDEAKLASLKTIFQNRALASAIALTNEGAAGFATMTGEIEKTTAMEVAGKRLDNLSGDIEILKGNIETLAIKNGSQLQEFFRGLVQGITGVVQWFANLSDGTQAFIFKALAIGAVVLVAVGMFGLLAGAILNIVGLIMRLGQVFQLIKLAILAVRVAMVSLNLAFLANPITWIILAVIALIAVFVLLWNNNEAFRNFFIKLWEGIKTAVSNVIDWFRGLPAWFSSVWEGIKSGAETIWNNILTFFRNIPNMIMQAFLNFTLPGLLIQHWDTIWATIQTVWNNIMNFFRALPGNIANFFAELPGRVGYFIGFMAGTAVRLLITMALNIHNTIVGIVTDAVAWFQQLPTRIAVFFLNLYYSAINLWNQIRTAVVQKASELVAGVITFVRELPGKVATYFQNLYNSVRDKMSNAANSARSMASTMVSNVIQYVRDLPGRVGQFFSDLVTRVRQAAVDAASKALQMGRDMYNGVRDGIQALPGAVAGILGQVISAVREKISQAFNAVKDFASGLWEGFKDGLGIHSPSFIERAMWAITDNVDDETRRLARQVPKIQKLGAELDGMGSNAGSAYVDNVVAATNLMADEIARAQAMNQNLMAAASNIQSSSAIPPMSGLSEGARLALSTAQNSQPVAGPTAYVKVEAPQNMDPEQVGTMVGRRTAYAMSANATSIPKVTKVEEDF